MSIVAANEIRTVAHQLWRQQVMDVLRAAAFIGTLLLVWVSLRPFVDLSGSQLKDLTTGNEAVTYAAFGCLALLTVALAMRDNMRGLVTLLSPGFVLFGGWVFITVVLSLDPSTSIRRFALTACVIAVASTLMLLPKSQAELMRWLQHRRAGAAGGLLSRNTARASFVDPSGDRCAGAGVGWRLARVVWPQERRGAGDGALAVHRNLRRSPGRAVVGCQQSSGSADCFC